MGTCTFFWAGAIFVFRGSPQFVNGRAVKAVRLMAHGAPGKMDFGEVPDPKPGSGDVVVRVKACGLNHLDVWAEKGELPIRLELPRTQGCEIAGEIAEVGADVKGWK